MWGFANEQPVSGLFSMRQILQVVFWVTCGVFVGRISNIGSSLNSIVHKSVQIKSHKRVFSSRPEHFRKQNGRDAPPLSSGTSVPFGRHGLTRAVEERGKRITPSPPIDAVPFFLKVDETENAPKALAHPHEGKEHSQTGRTEEKSTKPQQGSEELIGLKEGKEAPFLKHKGHRVAIMILSRQGKFSGHVRSHPVNWFHEMNRFADIIYVVGGGAQQATTTLKRIFLENSSAEQHNVGVLTLAGVSDTAYPPLEKTTRAYEYFTAHQSYDFILKSDDDTYIHGPRLERIVRNLDPKKALYMGRPLHHCLCQKSFDKEKDSCSKNMGVHYCSGAAYVLSRASLEKMRARWALCRNTTALSANHDFECRSSDSTVGWCLNQAGIVPTPAADPGINDKDYPNLGYSWAEPTDAKPNQKRQVKTLFCQERNMWGGVKNRGVAGKPYMYVKNDLATCALFHPLKRVEHFRYVRYAILRKVEETAILASSAPEARKPPQCQLAIGVLCRASSSVARFAIRSTWGEVANVLQTVKVYFLLGNTELSPHLEKSLKAENNTHKDIVMLNMTDSYRNLFQKSYKWFGWASQNTDCRYIFKTDDDGYVRVLTLLDHLLDYQRTLDSSHEVYYGNQMWDSGDVIQDPKNAWYMYDMYPHKKFPNYMSGSGYGLTSKLARFSAQQAESEPNFRVEDAGMGICVSKFKDKKNVKYLELGSKIDAWGAMSCSNVKDILDNPAFNIDFNMYGSFNSDLDGNFCHGKDKRNLASPSSHVMSKEEIYQFKPKKKAVASAAKKGADDTPPAIPPWEWSKHPKMLKKEILWGEIQEGSVYYGTDVSQPMNDVQEYTASEASKLALAHMRTVHNTNDNQLKVEGQWKIVQNWEFSDFLLLVDHDSGKQTHGQHYLVHVPYRGGAFAQPVSNVKVENTKLSLIVPFACRLTTLKRFLNTVGKEFASVKGGEKIIIIAWGLCNTDNSTTNKVGWAEIEYIVGAFIGETNQDVQIKGTGRRFSRSSTLNLGLATAEKGSISVILDIDMTVTSAYFYRSRAFARKGESAYFPITFSEYNPALSGGSEGKVTYKTGKWRNFGYGMVSVATADATVKYDASNTMWGMEDVVMHRLLGKQGLYLYRLYDMTIKHVWHEKDCSALKSDPKRHFMCLGSKLSVEGNWRQLGTKILDLENRLSNISMH